MANRKPLRRNDRCPCGSGRKFKLCCAGKTSRRWVQRAMIVLIAAAMLGALTIGIGSMTDDSASSGAGRVWSAEHGHWHNAGGNHIKVPE